MPVSSYLEEVVRFTELNFSQPEFSSAYSPCLTSGLSCSDVNTAAGIFGKISEVWEFIQLETIVRLMIVTTESQIHSS